MGLTTPDTPFGRSYREYAAAFEAEDLFRMDVWMERIHSHGEAIIVNARHICEANDDTARLERINALAERFEGHDPDQLVAVLTEIITEMEYSE